MKSFPGPAYLWPAIALLAIAAIVAYLDLSARLDDRPTREEIATMLEAAEPPDEGPPPDHRLSPRFMRCSGRFEGQALGQLLSEHAASASTCFSDAAPSAEETYVQVLVDSEGQVREVDLEGGHAGDEEILRCVDAVVRLWPFPAPVGGECAVVRAALVGPSVPQSPPPRPDAAASAPGE